MIWLAVNGPTVALLSHVIWLGVNKAQGACKTLLSRVIQLSANKAQGHYCHIYNNWATFVPEQFFEPVLYYEISR